MNMDTKTGFIALLGVTLLVSFVSAYSFEVMSSTYDGVQFQNGCDANRDCRQNGEEYCGDNQIQILMCDQLNGICNVTCKPVSIKPVGTDIQASFTILPKDKRVGQPIDLTVKDKSAGEPIICYVEIYYGGRWDSEQSVGAKHLGSSMAVATNFMDMNYLNGTLLQSAHTDRQGILRFTPSKPGRYVLKLLTRFVVFSVGDSNGNVFNCSNGVCETALGEDATVCPQDCKPKNVTPIVPPMTCLSEGQNSTNPFRVCCTGLQKALFYSNACTIINTTGGICINCGNGICGPGENKCNCPLDCNQSNEQGTGNQGVQQQGGDMTMLIIVVVVVVGLLAIIIVLMKGGMLKKGSKQAVQASAQPANCPKCGTNTVPGCQYCTNCGSRV